jgi:hypothetical protein
LFYFINFFYLNFLSTLFASKPVSG